MHPIINDFVELSIKKILTFINPTLDKQMRKDNR